MHRHVRLKQNATDLGADDSAFENVEAARNIGPQDVALHEGGPSRPQIPDIGQRLRKLIGLRQLRGEQGLLDLSDSLQHGVKLCVRPRRPTTDYLASPRL
ncbi:hypothetical protein D3C87_1878430 [compost metagenome]